MPPISPVELDGADLRGVDVLRESHKIDLLISCEEPRFLIAVENKIDSGEHSDQLQRYKDTVAREFPGIKPLFVFLTPEGDDPSDEDWVSYSYADLHRAFTRRKVNAGAIGADVAVFLDHYLGLIGNRFMENADLDKLCRQIHINHRQALELIWERVGSPSSGLVGRMRQWIEERPGNGFISPPSRRKWNSFRPYGKDAAAGGRARRSARALDDYAASSIQQALAALCYRLPDDRRSRAKSAVERLLKDGTNSAFRRSLRRRS